MKRALFSIAALVFVTAIVSSAQGSGAGPGLILEGKRLFETATFGGNGRTCETCHSKATGTVSPADALKRFNQNPSDVLFVGDGSDDGEGHGAGPLIRASHFAAQLTLPIVTDRHDQRHRPNGRLQHSVPVAHHLDLCVCRHGNSQQREYSCDPTSSSHRQLPWRQRSPMRTRASHSPGPIPTLRCV